MNTSAASGWNGIKPHLNLAEWHSGSLPAEGGIGSSMCAMAHWMTSVSVCKEAGQRHTQCTRRSSDCSVVAWLGEVDVRSSDTASSFPSPTAFFRCSWSKDDRLQEGLSPDREDCINLKENIIFTRLGEDKWQVSFLGVECERGKNTSLMICQHIWVIYIALVNVFTGIRCCGSLEKKRYWNFCFYF